MPSIVITLPTQIEMRGKVFYLNLNNYRNWHYQVSNKLKIEFSNLVSSQLLKIPSINKPIRISYYLYVKDKRRKDIANVCCVVAKFFEDTLQEYHIIEDDDFLHYPKCSYEFAGYDKNNPRIEARIEYD